MSTNAPAAYAVIRNLIEQNKPAAVTALRWQDQRKDSNGRMALPSDPATFAYTEFLTGKSGVIENGGGRGANRHRNPGTVDILVFSPKGGGLTNVSQTGCLDIAEQFAALFRPFNQSGVKVDSATAYPGGDGAALKPKGFDSAVGDYFWAAVEVDLYFDLIG